MFGHNGHWGCALPTAAVGRSTVVWSRTGQNNRLALQATPGFAPDRLRLGPLPKTETETETVKLSFACHVALTVDLDRHAALHGRTYGEDVDAVTLIHHMLARDRDSSRAGRVFEPGVVPLGARRVDAATVSSAGPLTTGLVKATIFTEQ